MNNYRVVYTLPAAFDHQPSTESCVVTADYFSQDDAVNSSVYFVLDEKVVLFVRNVDLVEQIGDIDEVP